MQLRQPSAWWPCETLQAEASQSHALPLHGQTDRQADVLTGSDSDRQKQSTLLDFLRQLREYDRGGTLKHISVAEQSR
ncbi:hypothetical protein AAFF_G00345970 [Aldrovandia affinis]|uniref:Uncharacterized protein n=1 Tax=Aldrovandia affinis TaxID=143900 RepID=A0AAD7SJE2_9TELE|nr:hypothetical protein AAFF_G00345970 [Aldrovandia affinis]